MVPVIKTAKEAEQYISDDPRHCAFRNVAEVALCLGFKEASAVLFRRAIDVLMSSGQPNKNEKKRYEWYYNFALEGRELPWEEELGVIDRGSIIGTAAWDVGCLGGDVIDDIRYLEDKKSGTLGSSLYYSTWHLNVMSLIARGGKSLPYPTVPEIPPELSKHAREWYEVWRETEEKGQLEEREEELIEKMRAIKLELMRHFLKSL